MAMFNTSSLSKRERLIKDYALIASAALLYAIGFNLFFVHAGTYSGGFTGLGQLIQDLLAYIDVEIALGNLTFLLNLPLLILAYKNLNKSFAIKTVFYIVLSSMLLNVVPKIDVAGGDFYLSLIVGAVTMGYAIGRALRSFGSTGGSDIIASLMMKKDPNVKVGKISLILNACIYVVAAVTKNVEIALYSFIASIIVTSTLDRVFTQSKKVQVQIVTNRNEIKEYIMDQLHRGISVIDVTGGKTGEKKEMFMSSMTEYDYRRLQRFVSGLEGEHSTFITTLPVMNIVGYFEKVVE